MANFLESNYPSEYPLDRGGYVAGVCANLYCFYGSQPHWGISHADCFRLYLEQRPVAHLGYGSRDIFFVAVDILGHYHSF